jgi:hypothetical protein
MPQFQSTTSNTLTPNNGFGHLLERCLEIIPGIRDALSARDALAASGIRLKEELAFLKKDVPSYFVPILFDDRGALQSLGWYMSRVDRESVQLQMPKIEVPLDPESAEWPPESFDVRMNRFEAGRTLCSKVSFSRTRSSPLLFHQ